MKAPDKNKRIWDTTELRSETVEQSKPCWRLSSQHFQKKTTTEKCENISQYPSRTPRMYEEKLPICLNIDLFLIKACPL